MKIAVDARELTVNQTGGFRTYAESVVTCLSHHEPKDQIIFYTDREPEQGSILRDSNYSVCPPSQLPMREQISLPRRFKEDGVQLAHFLSNTAPINCPVPYVLTLHDIFCIERPISDIMRRGNLRNKFLSLYAKYVPLRAVHQAKRIITVSNYSAREISFRLDIKMDKIKVVPQSLHQRYRRVDARDLRQSLLNELGVSRLALLLGSREPRKNVARTLQALTKAANDHKGLGVALVWPAGLDFKEWTRANGITPGDRVRLLTDVSDLDLVRLYSAADLFLFVSQNEGFGLPVIEAMACECPVITSNVSCLPDTAGGAALLVDPTNVDDISSAVKQLLDDDQLREKLVNDGLSRAAEFSAERAMNSLMELYRSCLD